MLKLLLKKQITEVFRGYFYDSKKNKTRSRGAVIGWFIFFGLLMGVVLGGLFAVLSVVLCGGLYAADMMWLYYAIMGLIAVAFGAFGSVFNTYSGLYLGKDNDLLLSMPIPVHMIMASRLLGVYILGLLYSGVAILPAVIVAWILTPLTLRSVIGGLFIMLLISVLVMILSCLLGWVVAKISVKLKNKSFITVLISLTLIGAYYFIYFRAQELITDLLANAALYGDKIKGSAYIVYLFGKIGEGDPMAILVYTAALFAILFLTLFVIAKTFLKIATTVTGGKKAAYREKKARMRSPFFTCLGKELGKFKSSPNYLLNCGLGVVFVPALSILLFVKGKEMTEIFQELLGERASALPVLVLSVAFLLLSLIIPAAPSVSLEGKSVWIYQSLPLPLKTVLRAKAAMQFAVGAVPILFFCGFAIATLHISIVNAILFCLAALLYTAVFAVFCTVLNVKLPNLKWTNEMVPVKQGASVGLAILFGWLAPVLVGGLYVLVAYRIGLTLFLAAFSALLLVVGFLLTHWMDEKGAAIFATLS